jgi:hypothetical protein
MAGFLPDQNTTFITICKKAYKPLFDENDELLISNDGALRLGLEALLKEDASDNQRALELWAEAKQLLCREIENEIGAGAQGTIQMPDDFEMESVGCGL